MVNDRTNPISISEFQKLMDTLYGSRDNQRGISKTLLWFFSEIGELSEAIRLNDKQMIEEEMADVFAWLSSLANILNIDLEKAVEKKYPLNCPKCFKSPCECPFE